MPRIYQIIGAGLFLLAVWVIFYVRRSQTPDPIEKEKEEDFDEKVVYGDFEEFVWRKRNQAK